MNELGQWLRETREAKGLTLAEVESQTRIRQKFLAALEAEEWDLLPGEVTARGFLRKYASFLGLDVGVALERFREATAAQRQALLGKARPTAEVPVVETPQERDVDYRPIEMELEQEPPSPFPWRPVLAAVLMLALIVAAWWVVTFQRGWVSRLTAFLPAASSLPDPLATDVLAPEPTATRIVIRVTATPTDTPEVTATPEQATRAPTSSASSGSNVESQQTLEATPTGELVSSIRLQVAASERAWIRVRVDGEDRLETILEPGSVVDWEGQESVNLRTGNAAGLQVVVNGQDRGTLGGPGEVIELLWTLVGGQLIESTPEVTPTPVEDTPPGNQVESASSTPAPS